MAFFYDESKSSFEAREIHVPKQEKIDNEKHKSSGAVAWGDYDGDGDEDIVVASLAHRVTLMENDKGIFHDVTSQAGLRATEVENANAVYFADYNNDSCVDLLVVSGRGDSLFKNNCDKTFSNVTEVALPKVSDYVEDWGFSAAWGDYNNDSYVDLYIARYQSTIPNSLLRNNRDGTFTDVTAIAGVEGEADCKEQLSTLQRKNSLQPVWLDYNKDGWVDLMVANDSHSFSPLYENNKNGTFSDKTLQLGLCRRADAMGVAVGDYDNDLDIDIYVTNAGPNLLWEQQEDGRFIDVAEERGVADEKALGWGAVFFDFDNDADLDLYVVNGDVKFRSAYKAHTGDDRANRLFENSMHSFFDITNTAWASSKLPERGVALADYNKDGSADLLIGRDGLFNNNNPLLLSGRQSDNNWVTITLRGKKSNPHGIGATIYVTTEEKTQVRQITSGDSFTAQSTFTQLFGLAKAGKVSEIRIVWPGGNIQRVESLAANQHLIIEEN